ncbi:hypothetical protein ACTMTJ_19040 [Phytohabitans sp. LJ34]|uniref:hypothetical protein n=1 Tax=Phytohabitans sp. LJ34 TaxID=3452217 RepID=UPI003F8A49B9
MAVLAAAGLLALGPSTAAWAATISINPGNVPTTAEDHEDHGCDFGGGPFPDKDVWVFVLPGNKGEFVSVTATFGANGSLTIPTDGGAIVDDKGTSKAWITTPAGWTLTAATAEITGEGKSFNLTHTCPASSSPSPSPSKSPSPSPSESESPGPTPTTPGPVPSADTTTGPVVVPSGAPETGGGGGVATTGGMALGIGALTLAGAGALGLVLARRRRRGA